MDDLSTSPEPEPVVTVERIEVPDEDARLYLESVFALFEAAVADPAWRRWWTRAEEGDLTLTVATGDDRNYPRVERVPGGVAATICRRDIDFGQDESARLVARTNVQHLFLTMQDLLDLKTPPDLPED